MVRKVQHQPNKNFRFTVEMKRNKIKVGNPELTAKSTWWLSSFPEVVCLSLSYDLTA